MRSATIDVAGAASQLLAPSNRMDNIVTRSLTHRIVIIVRASRSYHLDILVPYLLENKGIAVNCILIAPDAALMEAISALAAFDSWFLAVPGEEMGGPNIQDFYRENCSDPKTIYVRLDGDIVWMLPTTIRQLVDFRIANRFYSVVHANTINNSLCSFLQQCLGCLPTSRGVCSFEPFGDVGWRDPGFAELCHEAFFAARKSDGFDMLMFDRWVAWHGERISIDCSCWHGDDIRTFPEVAHEDEERWLSIETPHATGRPAVVVGRALASHFAYEHQRSWLEASTRLLERYQELSNEKRSEIRNDLAANT